MSFLSVVESTVKGLNVVVVSYCCGYLFTAKLTFELPSKFLKSGTNLLTAKNTSPAILGPDDLPYAVFCLFSKSMSNDFIKEETIVVDPSSFT